MKRTLVLAALLSAGLVISLPAQQATTFESLTVAGTAIGLASATRFPSSGAVSTCSATVETAPVRYRIDSGTPTASVGTTAAVGDVIFLNNIVDINQFLVIRTTGASALLPFTCTITGTTPAISTIAKAPGDVSGTLPVANGGTGNTTLTAHGVLVGEGTSAIAPTAAGAANTVLIGNGASADPTFSASPIVTTLAATTSRVLGGTGIAAAATTFMDLTKVVTGIANNTATDVITVTVPNAAHAAMITVDITGSLGAGGAIGAFEATGVTRYQIAVARTAGVATVATASSAIGGATSAVAGASTITVTAVVSAITGAVGVTQTFTIQVTIAHGSGSSTNHSAVIRCAVLNANATGITIS